MTEKQAIKQIEKNIVLIGDLDCTEYEMAIEALKKRIAVKPKKIPDRFCDLIKKYYCPSCGRYFGQRGDHNVILFNKERYCQGENCGQAIDWGET